MITNELMIHGAPARLRPCRTHRRNHVESRPARWEAPPTVRPPAGGNPWLAGREIQPAPEGPFIENDTPLVPNIMAESVWEEGCAHLNTALPREWMQRLVNRATLAYQRNSQFRSRIRGRGDSGRDYLWIFMRHWLAALVDHHRPDLFPRLPAGYATGREPSC